MLKFLSSLFGRSAGTDTSNGPKVQYREDYKEYCIEVAPQKEAGRYRVGARIYRTDSPDTVHQLIRADEYPTLEVATEQSLAKARQAIDQLGERLFRQEP